MKALTAAVALSLAATTAAFSDVAHEGSAAGVTGNPAASTRTIDLTPLAVIGYM